MLFKSMPENFNPQIHTEALSLASQMDKMPEVHRGVLSRFEHYTRLTSFLTKTNRIDKGYKQKLVLPVAKGELHDNAYRVQFKSLNILPAYANGGIVLGSWHSTDDMTSVTTAVYSNGVTASTVATNTLFSIAVKHDPTNNIYGDKFNPQDTIELDGGLGIELLITRKRASTTGDHYIYDGKTIGQAKDWQASHVAEDTVLMEGGNRFGEGSMNGFQRERGRYWEIFYSFLSRYTLSFTGNALDQRRVIWSDISQSGASKGANGTGYWQFEKEWEADEMFMLQLELGLRHAAGSMSPQGHNWFEGSGTNLLTSQGFSPVAGITPPRTSDGWLRQIKDTIDLSYNPNTGLEVSMLEAVITLLAGNSPIGPQGNEFLILGDIVGQINWDRAMKRAMVGVGQTSVGATDVVYNITDKTEVKLGFEVTEYTYLGNKFTFCLDTLAMHPGLVGRSGGLVGNGHLYVINISDIGDGVSNFELFARGRGRIFKKKYVDGMHSLDSGRDAGMFASSGFDGAFVHYLSELFPICYYKNTCAVIRASEKWNGGALAGNPQLNQFPNIMGY